MQNRTEKIKLIAGRLMRGPMLTMEQSREAAGNPAKIMRFTVENAVAAGLAYRDSSDPVALIDVDEARSLLRKFRFARGGSVLEELVAADRVARCLEAIVAEAEKSASTEGGVENG